MDPWTMGITIAIVLIFIWAILSGSKKRVPELNLKLPPRIAQHSQEIAQAASKYNLPPDILASIIDQESSGRETARGSAGEIGLMQLKQIAVDEIKRLGYQGPGTPSQDPYWNIDQGSFYFNEMLKQQGNLYDALVAYNQGPTGARKEFQTPGQQAGEEYAAEVLSRAEKFRNGKEFNR